MKKKSLKCYTAFNFVMSWIFLFYILVIRTISTRCGPEVWPWLRRNGSVNVFGDDGCLMYLEKFNANGESTTCRQLKYQSPTCLHATFLNERYLVGSNTFVFSIFFQSNALDSVYNDFCNNGQISLHLITRCKLGSTKNIILEISENVRYSPCFCINSFNVLVMPSGIQLC